MKANRIAKLLKQSKEKPTIPTTPTMPIKVGKTLSEMSEKEIGNLTVEQYLEKLTTEGFGEEDET